MSDKSRFFKAIKKGDVAFLREFLEQHPEYLERQFRLLFLLSYGCALAVAAHYNQPQVIQFLVKEKNVDINRRQKSAPCWTALHFACSVGGCEAAEMLIRLGADVNLESTGGYKPLQKSAPSMRQKMEEVFLSALSVQDSQIKSAQKTEAWTLTAPGEVTRDRELPASGYHITDIFNFEARCWTSLARDLKSSLPVQSIVFFDNMPDKQILYHAHAKLIALGGTAEATAIETRSLQGKARYPLSDPKNTP